MKFDEVDRILDEKPLENTTMVVDPVDEILSRPAGEPAPSAPDPVDEILAAPAIPTEPKSNGDMVDRLLDDPTFQPEGMIKTAGREAMRGALPSLGALAVGVKAGAVGGAIGGLPGAFIGGVGGAVLTAMGINKVQDTVLKNLYSDDEVKALEQQMALNRSAHPVAAWTGEMTPQLVALKPNPKNALRAIQFVKDWTKAGRPALDVIQGTKLGQEEFENLINVSLGAGTGAAGSVINKIQGGDVSWLDVMRDMAIGAVLNDSTVVGRALGIPSVKLGARGKWIPEPKPAPAQAAPAISVQPTTEPVPVQGAAPEPIGAAPAEPAAPVQDMAPVPQEQAAPVAQDVLPQPAGESPAANTQNTQIVNPLAETPAVEANLEPPVIPTAKSVSVTLKGPETLAEAQRAPATSVAFRTDLIKSNGGNVYGPEYASITSASNVDAIAEKAPDMRVLIKDTNGNKASMPMSEFARLSKVKAFNERIRSVEVAPNLIAKGIKAHEGFLDGSLESVVSGKQLTEENALINVEPIPGVTLHNNASVRLDRRNMFQRAVADPTIRNLLQEFGVKNVEIEPPHKFTLSEQGHITKDGNTIRLNADAIDPKQTMMHELGHRVQAKMSTKDVNNLIEYAATGVNENLSGYSRLGLVDEVVAEAFARGLIVKKGNRYIFEQASPEVKFIGDRNRPEMVQKEPLNENTRTKQAQTDIRAVERSSGVAVPATPETTIVTEAQRAYREKLSRRMKEAFSAENQNLAIFRSEARRQIKRPAKDDPLYKEIIDSVPNHYFARKGEEGTPWDIHLERAKKDGLADPNASGPADLAALLQGRLKTKGAAQREENAFYESKEKQEMENAFLRDIRDGVKPDAAIIERFSDEWENALKRTRADETTLQELDDSFDVSTFETSTADAIPSPKPRVTPQELITDDSFKLISEEADDGARIVAEQAAKAAREEANRKAQQDLFDNSSKTTDNADRVKEETQTDFFADVDSDGLNKFIEKEGINGKQKQEAVKALTKDIQTISDVEDRPYQSKFAAKVGRTSDSQVAATKKAFETGEWSDAFSHGDRVTTLYKENITGKIPAWNVRGAKIETSRDFAALAMALRSPYQERFFMTFLDGAKRVISSRIVTVGLLDASLVHPREVFSFMPKGTYEVIIGHNHPSGDPTPSAEDIRITKQLVQASKQHGIVIRDHVIVDGGKWQSLRENGISEFENLPQRNRKGIVPENEFRPIPEMQEQAPWELIRKGDLNNPRIRDAETLGKFVKQWETASGPDYGFIVYLNSKNYIGAVERFHKSLTTEQIIERMSRGSSEEFAGAVLLHLPVTVKLGNQDQYARMVSDIRKLVAAGKINDINVLDVSTQNWASTREMGLVNEEKTKYGKVAEDKASNDPATIEQLTMPRHVEANARPDLDPKTGRPIALADIRRYLSKSLDVPIRKGSFMPLNALGVFKDKAETIRQRLLNDLPTALHEVGHYLHFLAFNDEAGRQAQRWEDWGKGFDHELLNLGGATSKPSYSQAQRRQEGVANFVYHYMIDRVNARAMAPDFAAHWENTIQTQYPEIWKTLENGREMLQIWKNQPALAKVKSMIRSSAEVAQKSTFRQKWEQFQSDWVDSHFKINQALEQAEELGANPSEVELIRQTVENYRGGWRGKVEASLHSKAINLAGKDVGDSLADILKGVDTSELDAYLAAKRALEVERQGKRSGFDVDAARQVVKDLEGKYDSTRRKLQTYQKIQRDLLVDSGLISRDLAVKMDAMNDAYVPLYRIYEGLTGRALGGNGAGFINLGQGVFKLSGSDAQILSPLESIVKNTYAFRDLAERNQIARIFSGLFGKLQGGGRIAENITAKMKPVEVSADEVRGFLISSGIVDNIATQTGRGVREVANEMTDQLVANPAAMNIWRQARSTSSKDGIFSAWVDGKQEIWQISDTELYKSLSMADDTDAKVLMKAPGLNIMSSLTRILRAGATLTPDFMFRNFFRDPIGAFIYSKHKFVPIWDGVKGIMSAVKRDQWYWDWKKSGGSYSDFVMGSNGGLTETLKDVVKDPNQLQQALEWANPLHVIKNLEKLSEFTERGTRIAVYRRAVEAGINPQVAANLSKDTTLNYAKHGYKAYIVNKFSAFFNASIRDMDKLITEHAKLFSDKPGDRKTAVGMMIRATTAITGPSILAWYLGKDDPEIQALPAWRKTLFWNFNLSDMAGEPFIMSLPKPFMLGQLYGSSVEAALDYGYRKDPKLVGEWAKQTMAQLPNPIRELVGDAVLPTMGVVANYNWFTKRKIVADGQAKLQPKYQYNPETSEVAKAIGGLLDISPLKIDYMVRAHLGGTGKYGVDLVDAALVGMMGQDLPERPAKRWYDLPGIKAFHTSPYASDKYLDAFYRGLELAEQRHGTLSAMAQTKMRDFDPKWWEKNKNANVYYEVGDGSGGDKKLTSLRQAGMMLGEYTKAMLMVQNSRQMDAETKRQRLIQIAQGRNALARQAYENLLHPDDRR
jgi:hypothetical protein